MPLNVDIAMFLAASSLHVAGPESSGGGVQSDGVPTCTFGYAAAFMLDFRTFPAFRSTVNESELDNLNYFFSATDLSLYEQASGNPIIERVLSDCDPYRSASDFTLEKVTTYIRDNADSIYYSRYSNFVEDFIAFELAPLDSSFFRYESGLLFEEHYGLNELQARTIRRVAAIVRSEAGLRRAVAQGSYENFLAALDLHTHNIASVISDSDIQQGSTELWASGYPDGLSYMGEFFVKYGMVNLIDIITHRIKLHDDWFLSGEEISYLLRVLSESQRLEDFAMITPDSPEASSYMFLTAVYPLFVQDLVGSSELLPSYEYSPFLWARSRKSIANMTRVLLERERDIGSYPYRMCFVEANLQLADSVFAGTVLNLISNECSIYPDFPAPQ